MKMNIVEGRVQIRSESGRLFAVYDPVKATMEIVRNGEKLEIPLDELRKIGGSNIDGVTDSSVNSN